MRIPIFVAAVIGLSCAPAAVNASIIFSFAADDNADGPEFLGEGMLGQPQNDLFDGHKHDGDGSVVVNLAVDVNGNAPGGVTTFQSIFAFEAQTNSYGVSGFGGGFVHNYAMSGVFSFTDSGSGAEVLRIIFNTALFSSFSEDQFALGRTATIQGNEGTDAGLQFVPGSPLLALGITASSLSASEGFSFALVNMVNPKEPTLPLHLGASGEWFHHWTADASFAATAVPAPFGLSVMALSLFVSRRRRT